MKVVCLTALMLLSDVHFPSYRGIPSTEYRKGQRNTTNFPSNPVFLAMDSNDGINDDYVAVVLYH